MTTMLNLDMLYLLAGLATSAMDDDALDHLMVDAAPVIAETSVAEEESILARMADRDGEGLREFLADYDFTTYT